MKNIGDLLVTVLFLSLIFIFGVWSIIKPDEETSVLENRELVQRPDFSIKEVISGSYLKNFEEYYNDQFPKRSLWIEANNKFEKTFFQQKVVGSIFVNSDGYLIPILTTNSKSLKPKTIATNISKFVESIEKLDVDVYFALVPNKTTTMEYKLPNYIHSEANFLSDQLITELSINKHITTLDVRDAINPHSTEKNMYFYTDHHWKPKAAYYSYQFILEKMREKNNDIKEVYPMDSFSWKESNVEFLGSDARRTTESYVKYPDTLTIVEPLFDETYDLEVCYRGDCERDLYDLKHLNIPGKYINRYRIYFSGDVPEGIIKNPNVTNDARLLILKDSYANPIIQFFVRNFNETRVLDLRHYEETSVNQYIEDNNITEVLFIHNINSLITTPALTEITNNSS